MTVAEKTSGPTEPTPLEKILGFDVSEEIYDMLDFDEQLMIDLLIVGWSQANIALLLGTKQPNINKSVRRIRFKLGDSKLRQHLEIRQEMREGINGATAF